MNEVVRVHAMKACRGMELELHSFLTSGLSGRIDAPAVLFPGKDPGSQEGG